MAKLVFPSVGTPYRGFIGELRGWFNRIASYAERSPDAAAVIMTQVSVLATKLGGFAAATGATLALRNYLGTAYTPARTVTAQADGTVRMGSTTLPLISGTKVLMPQATGSWVDGYTFTIVNGAVTAVVAS